MEPIRQPSARMSGHDLAEHLFAQGGVAALVRHARGRPRGETDWLEFKASAWLLPEDLAKGETQQEQNWHIAKGIIALMNTSGGALVIGIREKAWESVPLDANDPKGRCIGNNLDDYIRKIIMPQVWPGKLSWTTAKGETMTLERNPALGTLLDWRHGPYKNADGREGEAIVVLVKPSAELCLATTPIGPKGRERTVYVLYRRLLGDSGEVVEETDFRKIEAWRAERQIEKPYYAGLCEQFDRESGEEGERRKVNGKIAAYYRKLEEKALKTMAAFTPLDAEENIFAQGDADAFYSPEAEEIDEEEDDWLRWDEEEDEDWQDDAEAVTADGLDGEGPDNGRDDETGEDDGKEITHGQGRKLRKGNLLDLLAQEVRAVVSGEPGGGKTTCLTYYALQFAREDGENPTLAVFIRMGQWRREGSLEGMMAAATGLDAIQLERLAGENRLRLVIDAVNECPDRFRAAAIVNIGAYLEDHPQVPAVVSTRHPRELSCLKLAGFRVQPMDEAHRRRYLARYLGDERQAEDLLAQIDGMPGGFTIAENPMLLRLVVEAYRESGGRGLPCGRAGLYRRSLAVWYKREKQKAERAGTPFSVGRRESLELLAELAFRGREKGFRDIPMEEASAIWGDAAERYLDALCQGPIVFRDGEDVHFRHETFQEYLCAEHLLAHPEDLPQWENKDYAQWGMVFAYTVELSELGERALPKSFQEAAWKLNPWLGVALGAEIHVGHQNDTYRDAVFGRLDSKGLHRALLDREHPWYRRRDAALRYIISVSGKCHDNWRRMEQSHLACLEGMSVRDGIALAGNWLVLRNFRGTFQFHAPQAWDAWIASATPDTAAAMLFAGLAIPDDFTDRHPAWLEHASLYDACRLISCGLCRREDFKDKVPAWIGVATPRMAHTMIELGLASFADFGERVDVWLQHPQYAFLAGCPEMLADESLHGKIEENTPRWVASASMTSAMCLIRDGFAVADDFKVSVPLWTVALPNPCLWEDSGIRWLRRTGLLDEGVGEEMCRVSREVDQACCAIRKGEKEPQDYCVDIPRWLEHATIAVARAMVQHGLASPECFQNKVSTWIAESTPEMALALTWRFPYWGPLSGNGPADECPSAKKGALAKPNNFVGRKPFWRGLLRPQIARILVDSGILDETDISTNRNVWRATVSPEALVAATRLKCFSWAEALALCALWGSETLPPPWNKLAPHFVKTVPPRRREENPQENPHGNQQAAGPMVRGVVEPLAGDGRIAVRVGPLLCTPCIQDWYGSWRPIAVANETIRCGQEIDAVVLSARSMTERGQRRWKNRLGIQQANTAWDEITARYSPGTRIHGTIVRLTSYGAFVQLEEGVAGFVRASEISWFKGGKAAIELLEIDAKVDAVVLECNQDEKKIFLRTYP